LAKPRLIIAEPLIARHDEGSETAAAKAKSAERRHKAELDIGRDPTPSFSLIIIKVQIGEACFK